MTEALDSQQVLLGGNGLKGMMPSIGKSLLALLIEISWGLSSPPAPPTCTG
jgi:hypothetical protein